MSTAAMKQALDFLERGDFVYPTKLADTLRLAIEQAEKYDQTALELCDRCGWKALIPGDCCLNCARQAEQKQPVAEVLTHKHAHLCPLNDMISQQLPIGTKLYTGPPQRQPLTEEEIDDIWRIHLSRDSRVRAIERKHRIGGEE